MQPARQFFDIPAAGKIPAHRVSCLRWGDASSPALVCLHGLTRNAHDFDYLARALAGTFHVICPDMPGRGDSEYLSDASAYQYATYVADMAHLLSQMRITKTHWVGTSMGGIVGMMLGNAMPGLLRSLVLNDIGIFIPAAGLQRIMNYAGVKMVFADRAEAEKSLREIWRPFGLREEEHFQYFLSHSLVQLSGGEFRLRYDAKITANFPKPEAIQDIDLSGLWPALAGVPVLLVRGAKSDILIRETARAMQSSHPNLAYHEIADTGHAPALMDGGQIALIKDWLDKIR